MLSDQNPRAPFHYIQHEGICVTQAIQLSTQFGFQKKGIQESRHCNQIASNMMEDLVNTDKTNGASSPG